MKSDSSARSLEIDRPSWGSEFAAGIVVALVALPLCLGIALASGAPLVSGLVTGMIGGLVVSWAGGTALLVSGPAAGLAAIVLAAILELGSFEALLAATAVAGVMQLVIGLFKGGRLSAAVPSSVVTGMLAAIGVLLILQQSAHLLGATLDDHAHGIGMLTIPFQAIAGATAGPALIGLLTLAVLIAWQLPLFARPRKLAPGPLVAVAVATAAAAALPFVAPQLALAPERLVTLPDVSSGPMALLTTPDFSALANAATWRVAVTLAIVASLETLLSMEATDRLDPLKRRSDGNRELVGQGIGNTLAGLLGGLPMTGVIVRSTANIEAGGKTWRSAFIHGILLVIAVLAIPHLLAYIPLPALAAVLVHTGYKLAHPSRFITGWQHGRGYFLPLITTVVAVVVTDLLIGVICGLILSAVLTLLSNARHGVEVVREAEDDVRVRLDGTVTFVHKPRLREALQTIPSGAQVTVDGSSTCAMDHDVIELLHGFAENASDRGIRVRMVGVPGWQAASGH